jgi:hypothetical protein
MISIGQESEEAKGNIPSSAEAREAVASTAMVMKTAYVDFIKDLHREFEKFTGNEVVTGLKSIQRFFKSRVFMFLPHEYIIGTIIHSTPAWIWLVLSLTKHLR